MSRRHRHYRKHRNGSATVSEQPTLATQSTAVSVIGDNLSIVREDLTRTAVISAILVLALISLSVLNAKQHWTLSLGSQLYTLLHIR